MVGVVVAIVFALLSYFYWWGAILVVAGSLGFWLAHWLLGAIGFSSDGFIITLIAVAAGVGARRRGASSSTPRSTSRSS